MELNTRAAGVPGEEDVAVTSLKAAVPPQLVLHNGLFPLLNKGDSLNLKLNFSQYNHLALSTTAS